MQRKFKRIHLGFVTMILLTGLAVGIIHAQETGLLFTSPQVTDGYVLFSPSRGTTTYLVNNAGEVVNTWESSYIPGAASYLRENGNMIRAGSYPTSIFTAGGSGGIIEEFNWDGALVWSYTLANSRRHLHHDFEIMPNGNLLVIAWDLYTYDEAIAAGRNPDLMPVPEGGDVTASTLWSEVILEINRGGQVVWEWRLWDHLVQDFDPEKPNYGDVMMNPGKVDLNYPGNTVQSDWIHLNTIDYSPALDQIMLSTPTFNEVWVINRGASGDAGGLAYRWGNRPVLKAPGGQSLFFQHDPKWLPNGNVLVFNNGNGRGYSSVDEWSLPVNADRTYRRDPDGTFAAPALLWQYTRDGMYADRVSGAQRLPNGNTIIAEGTEGRVLEVNYDRQLVWEYVSPFTPSDVRQIFRAERYAADYPGVSRLNN